MNTRKLIFISLFAGLLFTLVTRLSHAVRLEISEHGKPLLDRATFHTALWPPWPPSTQQTDMVVGAGFIVAAALIWAYQAAGRQQTRIGEEHGSASWAKPADIKPFVQKPYKANLLFTRTERLGLNTHKTQRNLNSLVIGSAGSGKSRYFVMPNLMQANTSFAVTDSKGELFAMAQNKLEAAGYKVRTLNLIDLGKSHTFNPLAYFSKTQPAVDVLILTENIVTNTNGRNPKSGGDFWEKTERALLSALVAYVYFTEGPNGTLNDVTALLAQMRASEHDETAKSSVDNLFEAVEIALLDLAILRGEIPPEEIPEDHEPILTPDDLDNPAEIEMLEGLSFAASQYNTYTQGAGETQKSIIISLGVRLAPLQIPEVKRLLSSDTIKAHTLGTEKTALFLILPDTHQAFSFLAAVFYEILFEQNMRLADASPERRLKIPIQCFMDEFANIGVIPSFERKIAVMRSRAISANIIVQTYAQGKALYKDHWETIVGNCDSTLFLGGAEPSTTKYLTERLGKETINTTDTSESRGTHGSWSQQNRKHGRELLTQDEISRLPTNQAIYLLRGIPPFKSEKLPAPN